MVHKVDDLGVLTGDVLLFGGPYSNLQATQAVLAQAEKRAVAGKNVICTGDVVAYCAQPLETLAAIRATNATVVAGNCEQQLAVGATDCGCGFDVGTVCDLLSARWFSHADKLIGAADRAWMRSLPDVVVFEQAGRRVAVVHGGMTDVARFIWPTSPETVFEQEIAALEAQVGVVDTVVAGHCGVPFERQIGPTTWVNAGVIGVPPHDGARATRFAILSQGKVTFHKLHYDVSAAFAQMQESGLCQGYDQALLSGYWPSEDVLPQELRFGARAKG